MRNLNSSNINSNSNNRKKKWLRLGAVGLALLLIPRRSSLKADSKLAANAENEVNNKVANKFTKEDESALK
ncbi:hypothetical protein [Psychrobacter maritimus]|uniref:hypothetical protein n=1 Tax=Psychrobacter maritimus TaxID=256325 RepID=UPI00191819E9|nr:hypothetical protein [Psychrobacter maritimus]